MLVTPGAVKLRQTPGGEVWGKPKSKGPGVDQAGHIASLTHLKAGIAVRGFGASPVRSAVAPADESDSAHIRELAAVIADAPAGEFANASVLGAV